MIISARAPWADYSLRTAGAGALAFATLAFFVLEKRRPLRPATQQEPQRTFRNLALGAMSMAVVNLIERPIVEALASRAERERRGLVQRLPAPASVRDVLAILAMDYTIYLWHVATHRVPFLWRFHLVHHVDLDLDSTTALRFHAADMAISTPYRAVQVALIGVSRRALMAWQAWFFFSILFHHSNLRLSERTERILALAVTTPRMHGIHHSTARGETESNWSSGFSFWDRLHRTFLLDSQARIAIGVPAYRNPDEIGFGPSLAMPFREQRDPWKVDPRIVATIPSRTTASG